MEGVCGDWRSELDVFPGSDRQRGAVRGSVTLRLLQRDTKRFVSLSEVSCPAFRSGLVPPEGSSGGGRGLCAGAGRGVAQAAVLVRHGGRSAAARTQGNVTTRRAVP